MEVLVVKLFTLLILYIYRYVYKMHVTLKFDDNWCCRIHSVSDDWNG